MKRLLVLMLLLNSTIAHAENFAIRNWLGGVIAITESQCHLPQVQALFINSKISLRAAYATDKDDSIVRTGCWIVDSDENQVKVIWEDWSVIGVAYTEWVDLDDITLNSN